MPPECKLQTIVVVVGVTVVFVTTFVFSVGAMCNLIWTSELSGCMCNVRKFIIKTKYFSSQQIQERLIAILERSHRENHKLWNNAHTPDTWSARLMDDGQLQKASAVQITMVLQTSLPSGRGYSTLSCKAAWQLHKFSNIYFIFKALFNTELKFIVQSKFSAILQSAQRKRIQSTVNSCFEVYNFHRSYTAPLIMSIFHPT